MSFQSIPSLPLSLRSKCKKSCYKTWLLSSLSLPLTDTVTAIDPYESVENTVTLEGV
jgi:hypothetical protein